MQTPKTPEVLAEILRLLKSISPMEIEKAEQEKAAQEKAAQEKAAQEKAAQEKAAQEKAAQKRVEPAESAPPRTPSPLALASLLLRETQMEPTRIAELLGFESPRIFILWFETESGESIEESREAVIRQVRPDQRLLRRAMFASLGQEDALRLIRRLSELCHSRGEESSETT